MYTVVQFLTTCVCLSVQYDDTSICVSELTGDVQPKTQQGPSKLLGDCEQLVLLRIILQNTGGIYLSEIQKGCRIVLV